MNAALYGHAVAEKMEAVDAALLKVNEEYKQYFEAIPSQYAQPGEEKPSSLGEFTILQWNNSSASIGFKPELRQDIADAAREAFTAALNS